MYIRHQHTNIQYINIVKWWRWRWWCLVWIPMRCRDAVTSKTYKKWCICCHNNDDNISHPYYRSDNIVVFVVLHSPYTVYSYVLYIQFFRQPPISTLPFVALLSATEMNEHQKKGRKTITISTATTASNCNNKQAPKRSACKNWYDPCIAALSTSRFQWILCTNTIWTFHLVSSSKMLHIHCRRRRHRCLSQNGM